MLYFAYGSNLLHQRLQARTPSATPLETAVLAGHVLRFHKIGDDRSGKCDAYATGRGEDRCWGVVYRLDPADKPTLDAIEGVGQGYALAQVTVSGQKSGRIAAFTYRVMPDYIDRHMVPFDWYKAFVQAGAHQNGFPANILAEIEKVPSQPDPDSERAARYAAILRSAGYVFDPKKTGQDAVRSVQVTSNRLDGAF